MTSSHLIPSCAAAILLFLTANGASAEAQNRLMPGQIAPAWTGTDLLTNETYSFPSVLKQKPAVLVFWATWCPYCKAFMPYAKAIQADYADHGIQIVSFNAKERGRGDPKAYLATLDFPMISIADADDIAEAYTVDFIPGLMVVDGDGEIIYRRGWTDLPAGKTVAEQWDAQVRAALDRNISEP
ncbi:MAG: TlpA disulfide reductase family protein [Pseudomonadota bacterium]